MAPDVPRVRKAVQQEDGGTGSDIDQGKALTLDRDGLGDRGIVHHAGVPTEVTVPFLCPPLGMSMASCLCSRPSE